MGPLRGSSKGRRNQGNGDPVVDKRQSQDMIAGGLGLLALALGGGATLGVLRPTETGIADNVLMLAVIGTLVGVVGLYLGRTRGLGRQIAILGTGVALIGLGLFGGAMALDALLDAANT